MKAQMGTDAAAGLKTVHSEPSGRRRSPVRAQPRIPARGAQSCAGGVRPAELHVDDLDTSHQGILKHPKGVSFPAFERAALPRRAEDEAEWYVRR